MSFFRLLNLAALTHCELNNLPAVTKFCAPKYPAMVLCVGFYHEAAFTASGKKVKRGTIAFSTTDATDLRAKLAAMQKTK